MNRQGERIEKSTDRMGKEKREISLGIDVDDPTRSLGGTKWNIGRYTSCFCRDGSLVAIEVITLSATMLSRFFWSRGVANITDR